MESIAKNDPFLVTVADGEVQTLVPDEVLSAVTISAPAGMPLTHSLLIMLMLMVSTVPSVKMAAMTEANKDKSNNKIVAGDPLAWGIYTLYNNNGLVIFTVYRSPLLV